MRAHLLMPASEQIERQDLEVPGAEVGYQGPRKSGNLDLA